MWSGNHRLGGGFHHQQHAPQPHFTIFIPDDQNIVTESREADLNTTSSTEPVGFIFTDLINAYKALPVSQELFSALYK